MNFTKNRNKIQWKLHSEVSQATRALLETGMWENGPVAIASTLQSFVVRYLLSFLSIHFNGPLGQYDWDSFSSENTGQCGIKTENKYLVELRDEFQHRKKSLIHRNAREKRIRSCRAGFPPCRAGMPMFQCNVIRLAFDCGVLDCSHWSPPPTKPEEATQGIGTEKSHFTISDEAKKLVIHEAYNKEKVCKGNWKPIPQTRVSGFQIPHTIYWVSNAKRSKQRQTNNK